MFSNRLIGYLSLFALIVFITGGGLYIYFTRYHPFFIRYAYADDIGNLKIENPVKVHGLAVGKVWGITRENNQARITLRMRRGYPVHKDYFLLNKDASLMGERGLYLDLGFSDTLLPDSTPLFATFAPGIAEGIRNAGELRVIVDELYAVINEYSATDSLNDTLFTTMYWKALRGIDRASRQLEDALLGKEKAINRFVDVTADFTGRTREQVRRLAPKASAGVQDAEKLAESTTRLLDKLIPLIDELTRYVDATDRGDNRLGKLLQDKEARDKLLNIIKKIRSLVGVMQEDGVGLDVDFF